MSTFLILFSESLPVLLFLIITLPLSQDSSHSNIFYVPPLATIVSVSETLDFVISIAFFHYNILSLYFHITSPKILPPPKGLTDYAFLTSNPLSCHSLSPTGQLSVPDYLEHFCHPQTEHKTESESFFCVFFFCHFRHCLCQTLRAMTNTCSMWCYVICYMNMWTVSINFRAGR